MTAFQKKFFSTKKFVDKEEDETFEEDDLIFKSNLVKPINYEIEYDEKEAEVKTLYCEEQLKNNSEELKNLLTFSDSKPLQTLKEEAEEQEYTNFLIAQNLSSLVYSVQRSKRLRENVLVVHPKIRWGQESTPKNTTSELQLEEAITLCRTIPSFNVDSAVIVGTDKNTKKKLIWGSGRLEKLRDFKLKNNVTAIMINVGILSPLQQSELYEYFQVPIYDRYNIVLYIFKIYARTHEAHLQISLAEIPYIRHRLRYMNIKNVSSSALNLAESSTSGGIRGKDKFDILRLREQKLNKKIKALISAKAEKCDKQTNNSQQTIKTCIIAIIGYTNAGKTTLIKKLINSQTIFGENRLFATLDTTTYSATLPSRIKIIFADTIGFISNLPIQLFASFSATLQYVCSADLLIHVQDLSHPNIIAQHHNVFEVLHKLQIKQSLIDSVISVGNKIDNVPKETLNKLSCNTQINGNELNMISCRTGEGLAELIKRIDLKVQQINGTVLRRLKLLPSSKAISFLYENKLVYKEPSVSDCGNYLVFEVFMNDPQMNKFKSHIKLKKVEKK